MVLDILVQIAILYGILVGVNIPTPFLGLDFDDDPPAVWYQPPGYVIPIIWFVLFALMGGARYLVLQQGRGDLGWWIIGLAVFCASYAYYTIGFEKLTKISALWWGLWGNVGVIALAFWVVWMVYPVSVNGSLLIIPTIVWTSFANVIVVGEIRRK